MTYAPTLQSYCFYHTHSSLARPHIPSEPPEPAVHLTESNNHLNNKVSREYVIDFWIGLLDGDGSIQVNHWRKKCIQYRIVIKLRNDFSNANKNMLLLIQRELGGSVKEIKVTKKGAQQTNFTDRECGFVIWVENSKKKIINLLKLLMKRKPLTTRLRCQLNFALLCLQKNDVMWYLENRDFKYVLDFLNPDNSRLATLARSTINSSRLFTSRAAWLSGFIEAKGCFCVRKIGRLSFSIGQKNDRFLLEFILNYLGVTSPHIISDGKHPEPFYQIYVYRKDILMRLISHFDNAPLLGEKAVSYKKFLQFFF